MEQILLTLSYVERRNFKKEENCIFGLKTDIITASLDNFFWSLQLLSLFEKRGSGTHYKFIINIQCKTGYLLSPNQSRCYRF